MKTPSINICAGAVVYPPVETTQLTEYAGGPTTATIPTAHFAGAPLLAVAAAREALERGGIGSEDIVCNAHAWVNYQGHDLWSPQHFIAQEIGAVHSRSSGVFDVCNGGESAIELVAMRLLGSSDVRPHDIALTTTADLFREPAFNRFSSDLGVWYGDSGSALVLGLERDMEDQAVQLLSARSTSMPIAEAMHRTREGFFDYAAGSDRSIDVRATKAQFLAEGGGASFLTSMGGGVRSVVLGSLSDAGISPHDPRVKHLLLPRIDQSTIDRVYLPPLHGVTSAAYRSLPRNKYGHLGAGDTPVNIVEFVQGGDYDAGDIALFVCAGAGFTVSCLCVRLPDPSLVARSFATVNDFIPA
ncbi:3-oxoacyl-[acyl-carrier-protein] synthase-3 [Pseudarthrobacter sp. PvP004]|jgi:3-oxoacyl-[acyl-carrier-protein] synthase-3|uniref:3-oxoacyl-(Acyl-carrier-protein) synthase III n=1 Tax=Paenarthrobacter aurescens (strain TC1) TaxID=290340 RepID=A1RA07_PAEAT|nr:MULTISPECIES: 3-oxoacyl-[acyl-carrier-protein] synthase III C-terminal domain-containing protein [Micrococcaceae]ABM08653.1 putative 3-oxoacyl-(acyl-carrier-protein) synthase III [Paenarthrobacter aurescens TC1]MBP2269101.1 3-oxoacyl-[acyl-carrier-protein] synthase-3 [Pseudarthrobacter sp. PvP004]